jgi:hypothetical protein
MAKELTFSLYIGGKEIETLSEEQRARMAQRLSESMSLYYTQHPEEYEKIKGK